MWEGQCSPLSTAETATSGTGGSHVPAGVVAVPSVGARSQKHREGCREAAEQLSSADTSGCNGEDASLSPGDGGQMLAHTSRLGRDGSGGVRVAGEGEKHKHVCEKCPPCTMCLGKCIWIRGRRKDN